MEKSGKNNLHGIIWILINNLVMAAQTALIKNLSMGMDKFQVVILYKITVVLCMLPIIFYKGTDSIKTKKMHLLGIKALLSITAAMVYVSALKHMNITEAMAVGYTEPLFVSILAVFLLKEYVNKHVIFAAIVGFGGVLVVTNPWGGNLNIYYLVVLGAAVIWAFDMVVIKMLGRTESPLQYVFYVALFSSVFGLGESYLHSYWFEQPMPKWSSIDLDKHWLKLLSLAILYFIHVLSVFKAYQKANISILAPFDFSRIVFATMIEVILLGGVVKQHTIIGAFIIVSSSVYIVWKKEEYKQQNKLNKLKEKLES